MIKVWFLLALISFPNTPAISYKGFAGYLTQEECEEKRIIIENEIIDLEKQSERAFYLKTFCLEMDAFESQFIKKKKLNNANTGA